MERDEKNNRELQPDYRIEEKDGCWIWPFASEQPEDRPSQRTKAEESMLARLLGMPGRARLSLARSCGNELCFNLKHISKLTTERLALLEAKGEIPSIEEYLDAEVWTPVRDNLVDIALMEGHCEYCAVARAVTLHEIVDSLTSNPHNMLWLSMRWLSELTSGCFET